MYKSAGSCDFFFFEGMKLRIIQQRKPDGIAFDKWELEEKGESKTAKEFIKEENKKKMESFGTQKRTK